MSKEVKDSVETKTIVERVREGLSFLDSSFDTDLLVHINVASYDLYQNSVISTPVIYKDTTIDDLEPNIIDTESIISYLTLSSKLHLDPPQPSMVSTYVATIARLLDRLAMEVTHHDEKVGD